MASFLETQYEPTFPSAIRKDAGKGESHRQDAFCEHCREYADVSLASEKEIVEPDGIRYVYPVQFGVCQRCGGGATPDKVLEANRRSVLDAVRAENGIVSRRTVDAMPDKYNMGKAAIEGTRMERAILLQIHRR